MVLESHTFGDPSARYDDGYRGPLVADGEVELNCAESIPAILALMILESLIHG